jgi:uncharacterized delta-60 repeat protein
LAGLLVLSSLIVATGGDALATPGGLDASFGGDGKITTNPTVHDDWLNAVAVQPNGRIVVAGVAGSGGRSTFALARYREDGRLDRSFGGDGLVRTRFKNRGGSGAEAVAIQPDGKIVAVGSTDHSRFALARYNRDGTLDPTFNRDGKATTALLPLDGAAANSVAILPGGKILVAGTASCVESLTPPFTCGQEEDSGDIALARYDPDGTLDTTFGDNGRVLSDVSGVDDTGNAMALQSDGKFVVAGGWGDGGQFQLVRYDASGSVDSGFGSAGVVRTTFPNAGYNTYATDVAVQPDGKIVAAGAARARMGLARYKTDGGLDPTFSGDGLVTTGFSNAPNARAFALALQGSGKIIAAGRAGGKFALARYAANGSLDSTFSGNGKVTTEFFARKKDAAFGLAVQANQRILAVGYAGAFSRFALARYGGG